VFAPEKKKNKKKKGGRAEKTPKNKAERGVIAVRTQGGDVDFIKEKRTL